MPSLGIPVKVPLSGLQQKVGWYVGTNSPNDAFHIVLTNGFLAEVYSGDGGWGTTLYPKATNSFLAQDIGATCHFTTDTNGLTASLVWNQGVTVTYARRREISRLAITRLDQQLELSLSGDADRKFGIQSSVDLLHWIPFSTNSIWDNPIPLLISAQEPTRFFRLVE